MEEEQKTQKLDLIKKSNLSNYEIIQPLGRGAHSFVYKVMFKPTKQIYAMKVMSIKNEKDQQKIKNEIAIHKSLSHPNIVQYIDHFKDKSNYYLVLEYCQKGELYTYIQKEGKIREENELKKFTTQLIDSLIYLVKEGIIHGDIKLGNILMNEKKILKINDFGLSQRVNLNEERLFDSLETQKQKLQKSKSYFGTPNYMAPEQILRQEASFKSDIWSLGCVFYALFHGKTPFEGPTVEKTLENVINYKIKFSNKLPQDYKILLKKTLDISEAQRPAAFCLKYFKFFETEENPKFIKRNSFLINLENQNPLFFKTKPYERGHSAIGYGSNKFLKSKRQFYMMQKGYSKDKISSYQQNNISEFFTKDVSTRHLSILGNRNKHLYNQQSKKFQIKLNSDQKTTLKKTQRMQKIQMNLKVISKGMQKPPIFQKILNSIQSIQNHYQQLLKLPHFGFILSNLKKKDFVCKIGKIFIQPYSLTLWVDNKYLQIEIEVKNYNITFQIIYKSKIKIFPIQEIPQKWINYWNYLQNVIDILWQNTQLINIKRENMHLESQGQLQNLYIDVRDYSSNQKINYNFQNEKLLLNNEEIVLMNLDSNGEQVKLIDKVLQLIEKSLKTLNQFKNYQNQKNQRCDKS